MRALSALSFIITGSGLIAAGIVLIVLASCDRPSPVFKDDLDVMRTSAQIDIVGLRGNEAYKAARAVENEIDKLNQIGYAFEPSSELYKLNEAISQGQSITVSEELKDLIEEAGRLYSASNGLFNPAAGELALLWEYRCDATDCAESPYTEEVQHLVDEKETEVKAQKPSMDDLILNDDKVASRKSAVKLDFGEIILGYALDRGVMRLKEMGVKNARIYIGGGVRTIGTTDGKPWMIGLPLLGAGDNLIGDIETYGDEAVITVHAFGKSIGKNSSLYRHVVDPRSGLPVKETQSVTVIHNSATTANAAAAALLINGIDGWSGIADKMNVHSIMLVTQDGTIYASPRMEQRIHWKQGLVHQHLVP